MECDVIEVSLEPDTDLRVVECCCFCRKATRYWYTPKDVACCQACAKHATVKDVPSKAVWFRREQIASGRASR